MSMLEGINNLVEVIVNNKFIILLIFSTIYLIYSYIQYSIRESYSILHHTTSCCPPSEDIFSERTKQYFEVNRIVKEEYNNLPAGQIKFNTPKQMKMRISYDIQATVSRDLLQINEKIEDYYLSKNVKVYSDTYVTLNTWNCNWSLLYDKQPIGNNCLSWKWNITQKQIGIQKLILTVGFLVTNSKDIYTMHDTHIIDSLERYVEVEVTPQYLIERFGIGNTLALLTLMVSILGIILQK
jgi:hypothetical protein